MINEKELDDWLEKVTRASEQVKNLRILFVIKNLISKFEFFTNKFYQVKGIISGEIDVKELEEQEKIQNEKEDKELKTKQFMQNEKLRVQEEKIRKGIKGPGQGNNYEKFCKFCFTEYERKEFEKCSFCQKALMTKEVNKFFLFV